MKVIYNAELDVHEIEHLRALANVNCEEVFCYRCPLNVNEEGNIHECLKVAADLCLRQNNINAERSKNEQENN